MPYVPGKPLRAQFVDFKDGKQRWGYVCGKSLCDTNANMEVMFDPRLPGIPFPILPVVFNGMFVDINPANGKERWAIMSECRPQPIQFPTVNFVCKDVWAVPFGVTDVIRFKFYAAGFPGVANCFLDPEICPFVYLSWTGGRTWTGHYDMRNGTSLQIDLTLTDTQDPDRPLAAGWPVVRKWEVTFSGCWGPTLTVQAHATCYFPFTAGGQTQGPLPVGCCASSDAPDLGFRVEGFTNRFMPAQFVDLKSDGTQRFLSTRCCEPDAQCQIECCGCEVSPFQMTFAVGGIFNGPGPPAPGTVCPSMNGDVIVTFAQHLSGTDCQWTGSLGSGQWSLRCIAADGVYRLEVVGVGPTAATWEAPIANWDCLGSNVMTLASVSGAACLGYPLTITVNPV